MGQQTQHRDGPWAWVNPASLWRLHIYVDLLLVTLAWLGAYATRRLLDPVFGYQINPGDVYFAAVPLIVLPWVASCWAFGLYQGSRMRTGADQIRELLRSALLGLLVISTIAFLSRELAFGRAIVLITAAYGLVLQGASRFGFFRLERWLRASGRSDVPALILGAGTVGIRYDLAMARSRWPWRRCGSSRRKGRWQIIRIADGHSRRRLQAGWWNLPR